MQSVCLSLFTLVAAIVTGVMARATMDTSEEKLRHSIWGLSVGVQAIVYLSIISCVVLMVGFLLYCMTCIKGTDRRTREARRQAKPSTIVIRPALRKSNQQVYQQQRVVRSVDQRDHHATNDEYETHSLTMYIPPED